MSLGKLATRDEILYMNIGYLALAIVCRPLGLGLLYAFTYFTDPIFIPALVWFFGIMAITAVQLVRPYYPFRVLMEIVPGNQLTVPQRRALAFLRGRKARRLAGAVGMFLSTILAITVLGALLAPFTGVLQGLFGPPRPPRFGLEHAANVCGQALVAGFFLLIASIGTHVGLSCWYILRHWERIQATYPPWPVTDLNRHFTYGLKEPKGRAVGGTGRPLPPPEHPVPNPLTRSISARDALAFVCYLIGALGLLVSVDSGIRALLRLPELTLEAALWPLGVPAASAGLLLLGWWLRRSR